jgi:hypothetical protein
VSPALPYISRYILFISVFTLLAFFSCDKPKISENLSFTINFVIDDSSPDFSHSLLLDSFAESRVLKEYGDNITAIDVQKISCYLSDFSGPGGQQFNSGKLEVGDPEGADSALIASFSDENLQSLFYEHKEMDLNQDGVKLLEGLIKNAPHKFRLNLSGITNMTPNDFTFSVTIDLKMIAYPL